MVHIFIFSSEIYNAKIKNINTFIITQFKQLLGKNNIMMRFNGY